jgi:hypothetical protein
MPYRPNIDNILTIDGASYRVVEHPSAPGMPYGQEGRQGIVYQLRATDGSRYALKVFKTHFRTPALVTLTSRLEAFADIRGLEVCRRVVLSPRLHASLLHQHPDLIYAVLMPWVAGPTWMDMVLERRLITAEQSLEIARALAGLLAEMEERGLAHCDLSAANLLLPPLANENGVPAALVDVEQIYGPGLDRPALLPAGSAGYAHKTASAGLWSAKADRFAGALLISEILGWCDEEVRQAANDESYFDPAEVQLPGNRYDTLRSSLEQHWGTRVAQLLKRAWRSDTLAECPTCGEWLVALPNEARRITPAITSTTSVPTADQEHLGSSDATVQTLMSLAHDLRMQGQHVRALTCYRQALALVPSGSGLAQEIDFLISDLEANQSVFDALPIGLPTPAIAAAQPDLPSTQPERSTFAPADDRPAKRQPRAIWLMLIMLLAAGLISGTSIILQGQSNARANVASAVQATQAVATVNVQQTATRSAIQTQAAQQAGTATAASQQRIAAAATAATLDQTQAANIVHGTSTAQALAQAQQATAQEQATQAAAASTATAAAYAAATAEVQAQATAEKQATSVAKATSEAQLTALNGSWQGTIVWSYDPQYQEKPPQTKITFQVHDNVMTDVHFDVPFTNNTYAPCDASTGNIPAIKIVNGKSFSFADNVFANNVFLSWNELSGLFRSSKLASGKGLFQESNVCSYSFTWQAAK